MLFERGGDALVGFLGCHGTVPELTLRIGDHLGESPVHLKNLLRRGRLTDSRADQRVSEAHTAVGDLDQVSVNGGLEGFSAGSARTRDSLWRRSSVESPPPEADPGCPGSV